jgi:MFS family permease
MQDAPRTSDWSSLKSVYRAAFFCSLGFFLVSFLLPIVAYGFMGASATQVALLFSMLTLGYALFSPVAGKIAARGLTRQCICAGASVRGLSYIGMAAAITLASIDMLIVNSLLWGLGAAFYQVGSDSEISERVIRENRAEAFGRREAANATGSIAGAIAGFLVLLYFNVSFVFLFYAAMSLLGGFVVIRRRPEPRPRMGLAPYLGAGGAIATAILALVLAASLDTFIAELMRPFVELLIINMFNPDIHILALVYLPGGVVSGLLGGRMGRLADRSSRVKIVAAAVVVSSSSSLLLAGVPYVAEFLTTLIPQLGALTETGVGLLLIAVLFTIQSATTMLAYVVISSVFGTAYEGRAGEGFGRFEAALGAARFAGPITGGFLWDTFSPSAPFLLVGVSGYLLIPLYYVGIRRYERLCGKKGPESSANQVS